MTSRLCYFAYGSNLSSLRLRRRIRHVRVQGVAELSQHRLRFRKQGMDGSAKCDIATSDDAHERIYGVVFEIDADQRRLLDDFEGLGMGYERKSVTLTSAAGERISAFTYYATRIDESLKPYHWYKAHVLQGMREHGLPAEYIRATAAIPSIADPDSRREQSELSIYSEPIPGYPYT